MRRETWRHRLSQAVETSGKSMREISLTAGYNPGYVYGILVDEKDPTIDKLLSVIAATDVSAAWVILGLDLSAEEEQRFKVFVSLDASQQAAVIQLAKAFHSAVV